MSRITSIVCASLMFLLFTPLAVATTPFSDGGTHTISGQSQDIKLFNSTTLIVTAGASISAPQLAPGVLGDGSANHVTVTGGSVTGGLSTDTFAGFGGSGIDMSGGTLNISGGSFTGGYAGFVPGSGVRTYATAVTISGGTFLGGANTGAGYAGEALDVSGGEIQIGGGTFHEASFTNFISDAAMVKIGGGLGPTHGVITGGIFDTGSTGVSALAVGWNYPATVDLKGGVFHGGLEVVGGESTLNVYGTGLTMTMTMIGSEFYDGHVQGTLLDGSQLSVDVRVYAPSVINLISVPEPSSLILASVGMAIAIIAKAVLAKAL